MLSTNLQKTTCFPSSHFVSALQMKNLDLFVLGRHGIYSWTIVLQSKVFVSEDFPINQFATDTIALSKVATLHVGTNQKSYATRTNVKEFFKISIFRLGRFQTISKQSVYLSHESRNNTEDWEVWFKSGRDPGSMRTSPYKPSCYLVQISSIRFSFALHLTYSNCMVRCKKACFDMCWTYFQHLPMVARANTTLENVETSHHVHHAELHLFADDGNNAAIKVRETKAQYCFNF